MRLEEREKDIIKQTVSEIFGESRILIFGSRLNLHKRGGDIDIFVIPKSTDDLFAKKIAASAKLERLLAKPVDIVVHYDYTRPIEQEALKGVEL